jgi:DNA-binding SARP family transcriptional activator
MALLALLAVARQRGLSRDKVVFYRWPDNEPERAGHLLSDSLYTLSKALGADGILSVGDQLRLNDSVVHSGRGF